MKRAADRRRSERGGILFKLVVFLAVAGALAVLAWMMLLPFVVCAEIGRRTGFEARVQRLVVNPWNGDVEARGFRLENPATFPAREFIEIEALRANVRLASLWSDQVMFDEAIIEVGSLTLVKREDGVTNVQLLNENVAGKNAAAGKEGAATKGTPPHFLARRLRLKVDRCVVLDYSGGSVRRRETKVGIDETFKDVTDLQQLLTPEVLRPLAPMTEMLSRLFPTGVGKKIEEAAKTGAEFLKEAGRRTGEAVKGFFQTLEEKRKP